MRSDGAMSTSPSGRQRTSTPPRLWTASQPAPASATCCVWCCSTSCMLSLASRGARIVCPLAAGSQAPRSQRGSGRAPRARRAAMRSGRGPSPQRRSWACATILRAQSLSPAASKSPAQGRRCRSGRLRWPGRSLICSHAPRGSIGTSASPGKRAERVSRPPHWTRLGSAWHRVL